MLTAVLVAVLITHTHAQTGENEIEEARMRKILSSDGTADKSFTFSPASSARVQTSIVNQRSVVSPASPEQLRALIFERYPPQGAAVQRAVTVRASADAQVETLPSDLPAEEVAEAAEAASVKHVPPTQGAKEVAQ